jgi:hypothetical protein
MDKQDNQRLDLADQDALAEEALAHALALPPGLERNDALKLASRLRCAGNWRPPTPAGRGRPRKMRKCIP